MAKKNTAVISLLPSFCSIALVAASSLTLLPSKRDRANVSKRLVVVISYTQTSRRNEFDDESIAFSWLLWHRIVDTLRRRGDQVSNGMDFIDIYSQGEGASALSN
jgi:hypothetical protein